MELVPQPSCPACGSDRRRTIGRRGDRSLPDLLRGDPPSVTVGVARCRACGHFYCDPLPAPEHLSDLYADASDYFPATEDERSGPAQRFVARLAGHVAAPGRLLDVGCGRGELLAAAEDAGWTAVGLEPTAQFADAARARGLTVETCYLDDLPVAEPFDVVTALAVLEHVPDPYGFLRQVHARLAPGGLVFVEVPNGRRLDAAALDLVLKLRRAPWTVRTAPLHAPFHLSEFSPTSVRRLFERAGFELRDVRVTRGRLPYGVPSWARGVVAALERISTAASHGLNVHVAAAAI